MSLPGIVNQYHGRSLDRASCINRLDQFRERLKISKPENVFLAYRWDKTLVDTENGVTVGLTNSDQGRLLLARSLAELIGEIPKETNIYLIGSVPSAYVANRFMKHGFERCKTIMNSRCPESYERALGESHNLNQFMASLVKSFDRKGVYFVNPYDALCDDTRCFIKIGEDIIYADHAHLTQVGASLVVENISLLED